MNAKIFTVSVGLCMFLFGFNHSDTERITTASMEGNQPLRTIVINSNDQMRFDTSKIKVKAGEKIKLTLNYTGKLPENVMGHNFVLLTQGTDIAKFSQAAMKAKGNGYIPSFGVIAHTPLIGGGESTTIEFTAPKKGSYDFICSFPGHYVMMKGKFIVE